MRSKIILLLVVTLSIISSSCAMEQKKSTPKEAYVSLASDPEQDLYSAPKKVVVPNINDWPQHSANAAKKIIDKYGRPTESTPHMLVWKNVLPFKRIVVYRDEVVHKFPQFHKDVVEHVVAYRIPINKTIELTQFDGSVTFYRTAGELTSRSESEEMNLLALNLADEIIMGKRNYTAARAEFGALVVDYLKGNKNIFMQELQFIPQKNTAYADHSAKSALPKDKKIRFLRQAQEEELTE